MNRFSTAMGLTGGIACGKSTVSSLLEHRGWTLLDTDKIAHELMEPEQPNWQNIVDAFGTGILTSQGTIDRRRLAERVFAQPELRRKLNEATHPAIRACWQARLLSLEPLGQPIAVMIPLLFETGLEKAFGCVLSVGCSDAVQMQRLAGRGFSSQEAKLRLASQWPVLEKCKKSDYVLWNEGSLAACHRQVDEFLTRNLF